jgi:ribosome maturation factor RimP
VSGDAAQHLESLLAPVVAASGLYLEGVEVRAAGKRRQVLVTVDLPDGPGGVGSDALAEVSRAVSGALDADGTISGAYVLEVSTPGTDRPLREPRHYRRAVGRLVRLRTRTGQKVAGRVRAADDDGITLEHDGAPESARRLAYADLTEGVVEVELRALDDAELEDEEA